MTTSQEYRKLIQLTGKSAVFIRGMMDYLDSNADVRGVPLRKSQEEGQQAVLDLQDEISLPYISKLSLMLQHARIIRKERRGQKYMVFPDLHFTSFVDYIHERSYGEAIEKEEPIERVVARSQFLDFMKVNPGIRISADNKLDRAAYLIAMDKFNQGEYDIVYLKREYKTLLAVDHDKGIEEEVIAMDVTHASVTNQ